ncbi:MAG: hypothetical protein EOP39_28430 [Rubrivivax sp.]|nr:MAG: hypothetical protein EOP39_28430 [Rubrivivax sp.]
MTHPTTDDSQIRAACAAFREHPPAVVPPDAAALRVGLDRIAETGLDTVLQRLLDDAPQGSPTDALAALLRPPSQSWDEPQEIDWAVRHWQASRAAGLLQDDLAADFGEYWRRLEWSALRYHLTLLGQRHADERRLMAYIVKTASRYVGLGPLKRAMEARFPEFFELGFSLR